MPEELIEPIANSYSQLSTQVAKREQLPYLRFCKRLRDIKFWRYGESYRQNKTKSTNKNIPIMIKRLSPHNQTECLSFS